jgi:WD40 repeat protein
MAFSPDGKLLASTRGMAVIIVRADSGEEIGELSVGRPVGPPQFTNRGDQLVVGVAASQRHAPEVQFWDVASLSKRKSLRVELPAGIKKPCAVSIAISPDVRRLVATVGHVVHTPHDVRLFDFQTERWHMLATDPAIIGCPAFSGDGRFLAQPTVRGAGPATVLLWDFATRTRQRLDCGPAIGVRDVAFSPNGQHLVAALHPLGESHGTRNPNTKALCIWELPTGKGPDDPTR